MTELDKASADPKSDQQQEWWRPSSLLYEDCRISQCEDLKALDPRTDFGSYRMLRKGVDAQAAQLATHNDVQPYQKIAAIAKLLSVRQPLNILDAGCGVGYTTEAIADHYQSARVLGVDISTDGVAYAKSIHRRAEFIAMPISVEARPIGLFDLVFCFEFYPFTRNADLEVQMGYINYFFDSLTDDGQLVIYQVWNNPSSMSSIYGQLVRSLPKLKFSKYVIPHPRLLSRLPSSLAWLTAIVLGLMTGRELLRTVIIVSRRNASANCATDN